MVNTVILVRHGMREDLEVPDWEKTAPRPHDTPLSDNGKQQAHDTAMYLKDVGICHIFSSPFLRTIQTADIIARELCLQVNIECGFSEFLSTLWFDTYPDIITRAEAIQTYSTINPGYHSMVNPVFPENDEEIMVYSRVKETLTKIFEKYSGPILIVGHGASVYQAGRCLVEPPTGHLDKMCAVNRFDRGDKGWVLTNTSVSHLRVYSDI